MLLIERLADAGGAQILRGRDDAEAAGLGSARVERAEQPTPGARGLSRIP